MPCYHRVWSGQTGGAERSSAPHGAAQYRKTAVLEYSTNAVIEGQRTLFRLQPVFASVSDQTEPWFGLPRQAKPLVQAGTLLGLGLGGFFDGIVFHQILQWHHMTSAVTDTTAISDLRLNVLLDGLFHAATYAFTVVGIILLWRARRTLDLPVSGRTLLGSVILGWGVFNFVEGTLNHHFLGIHHVWPDGPGPIVLWDLAFLTWGVLFIGGGYIIVRNDIALTEPPERNQAETQPDRPR